MISIVKKDPTFITNVKRLISEGKSYHYIEKELKVSRPTISTYAKQLGLHQQDRIKLKTHTLDLEYFKVIDTPEKAYMLGLLYADGCNTRRGLQIALVEEDKEVIEFVKAQFAVSNILRFIPKAKITWSNKWELSIVSMELSRQLTAVGIHPDKSLTIKFPTWLNHDLLSHFIRGFFDGDGSIWKSGINTYRVGFSCSSTDFIKDLQVHLSSEGIYLSLYKNSKNNGNTLSTGKKEHVNNLLKYIYQNSTFSMKRKREKAVAFWGGVS